MGYKQSSYTSYPTLPISMIPQACKNHYYNSVPLSRPMARFLVYRYFMKKGTDARKPECSRYKPWETVWSSPELDIMLNYIRSPNIFRRCFKENRPSEKGKLQLAISSHKCLMIVLKNACHRRRSCIAKRHVAFCMQPPFSSTMTETHCLHQTRVCALHIA